MTLPGREDGDGVPGQGNIFNHLGIKILTLVIPNCALLDERGRDMGWGPVRFDYWGILGDGCYLTPERWRNRDTWRWQMGRGGWVVKHLHFTSLQMVCRSSIMIKLFIFPLAAWTQLKIMCWIHPMVLANIWHFKNSSCSSLISSIKINRRTEWRNSP